MSESNQMIQSSSTNPSLRIQKCMCRVVVKIRINISLQTAAKMDEISVAFPL